MRRGLCLIDVGAVDVGNFAEHAGVGHQSEVVASAASIVFLETLLKNPANNACQVKKAPKHSYVSNKNLTPWRDSNPDPVFQR
jgi:hypothetical protein